MGLFKLIFNKIKEYNVRNWCVCAFILGILCYFLILSYCQVVYATYMFLEGDNIDQYSVFLTNFVRSIKDLETPFYSFNIDMGHNSVGAFAYYGQTFSITAFLCFIFEGIDLSIAIFLGMLIRAGLSCMTFQIYSVRYLNKNKFISLLFSLSYCLCAYQVSILIVNQIWADAFWLLPLLIYFLRKMINTKQWIPLSVCYFYLFVTNFYMGYVVGIFSFLYFIAYLFLIEKSNLKDRLNICLSYFKSVIYGFLLSAIFIVPIAYYFLNYSIKESIKSFNIEINILDLINQLMIGTNNGIDSFFPYIYCGLISIVCVPLFFFNKRIKFKIKMFYSILSFVLILSCLIDPLYLFWHAFDVPDSWGYRFAFLFSFLLCSMGCYALRYIKIVDLKKMILISSIYIAIYALEIYLQKRYCIKYQSNDVMFLLINIVAIVLISVLLCVYKKYRHNFRYCKSVASLLILYCATELIVNGYSAYYHNEETVPKTLSSNYNQWIESSEKVLGIIKENDSDVFYRVMSIGDYVLNSDSFFQYNGVTDFCSTENNTLRETLKKLGVYTSPKLLLPYGYTDFTQMLMGVKYKVVHSSYNYMSYYLNHDCTLTELNSYLGMGYLVDSSIKDFEFVSDNSFENLNILSSSMIGEELQLYHILEDEKISFVGDGISMNVNEEGKRTIAIEETSSENHTIDVIAPNNKDTYVQFSNHKYSSYSLNAPKLLNGEENYNDSYGFLTASYIKPMEEYNDTMKVTILMDEDNGSVAVMPDTYVAYYDKEQFLKLYDILKQNIMTVTEVRNGYVKAEIESKENDKLLYISIPYEKGWEAYVNGEKREITPLINDTFIGLEIDEGYNEIELKFKTPYARLGFAISVISLMSLIGIVIYKSVKERS